MSRFLDWAKPPKLNQDEIYSLNRPIANKEIGSVTINLWTELSPGSDGFTAEFYQIFKDVLSSYPLQQNQNRWSNLKLLLQIQDHSNTKPDKAQQIKETIDQYPWRTWLKLLNKAFANRTQTYIRKIIHHDQVGFIPEIQA